MPVHSNDDTSPIRLIWLPAIALGALCALLVWPQTHRLVGGQLRLTIPTRQAIAAASPCGYTDSTISDYTWPIIRRCANEHTSDLSQQIAAATTLPPDSYERRANQTSPNGPVGPGYKIKRLQELIPRFPDQPSLYATILRYSTEGQVRVTREEASRFLSPSKPSEHDYHATVVHSLQANVEMFNNECTIAERLDPDNGFFPMMHAIGLFESHNDAEALAAMERSADCSHWMEYLGDEFEGEISLQTEAFGEPGPLPRTTYAAALLLPHLSSIRFATELALYEAVKDEQAGRLSDGLRIRTAVRHVGSLMRCDSRTLIGVLVGMSLVKTSLMRPVGAPAGRQIDIFKQKDARDALLQEFDSYLAVAGNSGDIESVHAELDACVKAKAIISAGIGRSVFDASLINTVELSITDMIVLSTVIWLAALAGLVGLLAAVAGSKLIQNLSRACRLVIMMVLTLAAGAATTAILVQQSIGSVGAIAKLGQIWFNMSDGTDSTQPVYHALQVLSDGYIGIIATIPVLTFVLLAGLCLIWRVPVVAGVTRGIRGCVVPICSVLIIGYAVLASITATYETRLDTRLTETLTHEGRATARLLGTEWPGMVR